MANDMPGGSSGEREDRPVWAFQGEAVTCVRGHVVCHVARTIHVGDARSGKDFDNWQQPEPSRETPVSEIRCAVCRSVWVRGSTTAGYMFHFGDAAFGGWR